MDRRQFKYGLTNSHGIGSGQAAKNEGRFLVCTLGGSGGGAQTLVHSDFSLDSLP